MSAHCHCLRVEDLEPQCHRIAFSMLLSVDEPTVPMPERPLFDRSPPEIGGFAAELFLSPVLDHQLPPRSEQQRPQVLMVKLLGDFHFVGDLDLIQRLQKPMKPQSTQRPPIQPLPQRLIFRRHGLALSGGLYPKHQISGHQKGGTLSTPNRRHRPFSQYPPSRSLAARRRHFRFKISEFLPFHRLNPPKSQCIALCVGGRGHFHFRSHFKFKLIFDCIRTAKRERKQKQKRTLISDSRPIRIEWTRSVLDLHSVNALRSALSLWPNASGSERTATICSILSRRRRRWSRFSPKAMTPHFIRFDAQNRSAMPFRATNSPQNGLRANTVSPRSDRFGAADHGVRLSID